MSPITIPLGLYCEILNKLSALTVNNNIGYLKGMPKWFALDSNFPLLKEKSSSVSRALKCAIEGNFFLAEKKLKELGIQPKSTLNDPNFVYWAEDYAKQLDELTRLIP